LLADAFAATAAMVAIFILLTGDSELAQLTDLLRIDKLECRRYRAAEQKIVVSIS
jgi:hypothetical protein